MELPFVLGDVNNSPSDVRRDSVVLGTLVSFALVRPVQPGLVVVVELPFVLGDVNNSPSDVRRDSVVLLTYPLTPALFGTLAFRWNKS